MRERVVNSRHKLACREILTRQSLGGCRFPRSDSMSLLRKCSRTTYWEMAPANTNRPAPEVIGSYSGKVDPPADSCPIHRRPIDGLISDRSGCSADPGTEFSDSISARSRSVRKIHLCLVQYMGPRQIGIFPAVHRTLPVLGAPLDGVAFEAFGNAVDFCIT